MYSLIFFNVFFHLIYHFLRFIAINKDILIVFVNDNSAASHNSKEKPYIDQ